MVKPIPDGFHTVTPYLMAADLPKMLEFVQAAFGAKVTESTPDANGVVRHAEVLIGDSKVMIGQARDEWGPCNSSLYLYVEDTDAVYHAAMKAGATSIMEPADQFYGDRNAGVKDANGISWWIATHIEDVAPDELERRAKLSMK